MLELIFKKSSLIILLLFTIGACQEPEKEIIFPATDLAKENMIPMPLEVTASNSAFALDKYSAIHTSKNATDFENVGVFLSEKIKSSTHLNLAVNDTTSETNKRIIYIKKTENSEAANGEGYQLLIEKDSIILSATTAEGAFRGIQTLRQIIPLKSNDTLAAHKMWLIPTGVIHDKPNFGYRGSMLDVARHFFSVKDVKKYLDIMAYYKMNILHLHLTDDQGWRIEIKSWPRLTEVGGSTEVGGAEGGFYTQKDYKEIVSYAAERYITIIPEVDMPGHTNAASVAYPFLNGNGKTVKLYTGTKVGFSTFDTRKDTVYAFIDDVVREISAITPGPYFHIGGDESHVTKKKDYIYFVNKVEKIVQKHGKIMIGWDEITQSSIDSTTIAQHWFTEKNAIAAVKNGSKIILSPAKKTYLDMKYDDFSKYGLDWAAYIPVDSAYIWTPEKYLDGVPLESILGIEAPLWSETISNIEELEYLAFPRLLGYAELGWSTAENRDWENYKVRLANQAPYLDRLKVKYYRPTSIDFEGKR